MPNSVAFIPNGLRYLVFPDPVEAKEEQIGSVVISTQADPNKKASEGTVVAVGDGGYVGHSELSLVNCKYAVGDKLIYGQYSGYVQEFDEVKYLVLAESEILGQRVVTPFDGNRPGCINCGKPITNPDPTATDCGNCPL